MDKITIRDLVHKTKWLKVQKAIKYFYPNDKNNYFPVFVKLAEVPKRAHKDKGEEIERVVTGSLKLDEDPDDRFYTIHTNKYSLSFRKWNEMANIPISESTLRHYQFEEIVAHFIWEITFYGTEKDSRRMGKKLAAITKKIKSKK